MGNQEASTKAGKQWLKYKNSADKAIEEGKFDLSESVLIAALMEAESSFKTTDFRYLYTLEKLAQSLWYLGKFGEAVEHCKTLVEIHEINSADLDAVDRLACTINLAMSYHTAKQFIQADEAYKKAIQLSVELFGENHFCSSQTRSLYADLLNTTGKNNEANSLGVAPRVITVNDWLDRTVLKKAAHAPQTNQAGINLPPSVQTNEAGISLPPTSGDTTQSASFMPPPPPSHSDQAAPASPQETASPPAQNVQPAQQIESETANVSSQPPEDPNLVQISVSRKEAEAIYLSNRLTAQNNMDEDEPQLALAFYRINLKLVDQLNFSDDLLAESLESLTQISLQMGLHQEAAEHCKRVHQIMVNNLGPGDIGVAHIESRLASIYYTMADYENAVPMAKSCVDIYDQVGGESKPYLANSLHNLATLYHVQRNYDEAEQIYKRCLKIKNEVFGSDHPETARLLKSYAELLRETHREAEAKHMHNMATGMITGSWKAIDSKAAEAPPEEPEVNCEVCNTPIKGNGNCSTCGFEPKRRRPTSFNELGS